MSATWTDEEKTEVIRAYEDANPTPENSTEIVAAIAEEYEKTANGVRMVLTKAGVYIKKAVATKAAGTASTGTRVSKAAAQASLVKIITDLGLTVDTDIIDKMTGKAAQYFTEIMSKQPRED